MIKPYEILAPAGNFDALRAAVQNGADAVYLAGKDFGARKFANNFSDEELKEAVEYCHIRDVNVYVTVNTIVFNHEFEKFKEYIDFLYTIGVDAVIVQDIGALDYIRHTYQDLKVHCSTQMSVQTAADVKFLESLGVCRVILGREMSIEDIARTKKETSVELEAFVHGSLCISVSGQCLMSSMIGGRSGNRGSCAQPCRQKYTLYNSDKDKKIRPVNGDYLLSPKDLCTLEDIKTIIDAGIFSIKLEGRMKSPEYVATAVRAYRLMLEGIYSNKPVNIKALEKELKIFNRGFTKGHLLSHSGHHLMSMTSPGNQGYYVGKVVKYDIKARKATLALSDNLNHNDEIQIRRKEEAVGGRVERLEYQGKVVKTCQGGQTCEVNFKHLCHVGEEVYKTYDDEWMKLIKQTYSKESLQIPVSITANVNKDSAIHCSLSDGKNTVSVQSTIIPQNALTRSITVEEIKNQLSKLGGTPYKVDDIEVNLDEGLSVPSKELNSIRRELVDKLNKMRSVKYRRVSKLSKDPDKRILKTVQTKKNSLQLTFSICEIGQLEKLIDTGAMIIYYRDSETLDLAVEIAAKKNFSGIIIPEISRVMSDASLQTYRERIRTLSLDTVLVQSYGHIHTFSDLKIITDFNVHVINDYSYHFYLNQNFARITLSPELNLTQIRALHVLPDRTEIVGYGSIPVMVMKHCVISTVQNKAKNCGCCTEESYYLIDRKNEKFKIAKHNDCYTEIYNSKKLMLLDYSRKLEDEGIGYFRLNFTDETPEEVELVTELHRKAFARDLSGEDLVMVEKLKSAGVTYGHLNRGVD